MKIKKISNLYFILWLLVIISVSSIPHLKAPGPDKIGIDKFYHFSEYFILGIIFLKSVYFSVDRRKVHLLVIFMFIFPILDELHQHLIPGRQCSFYDILADTLGLLIPFLVAKYIHFKTIHHEKLN